MTMKSRVKSFLKNYLEPLFIVLFLFIVTTVFFTLNLNDINTKIRNYNHNISLISEIQILYSDIKSSVRIDASFVNYDDIVSKTKQIDVLIKNLKKDVNYIEVRELVSQIESDWQLALQNLERYKSTNSSIVSMSSYVVQLNKKIKDKYMKSSKNAEDIVLFSNSFIDILTLYVNRNNIDSNVIKNSLQKMYNLANSYDNADFQFFYMRLNSIVSSFKKLITIKDSIDAIKINDNLESLEHKLYIMKDEDIIEQQILALVLFIISLIVFAILMVIYTKSVRIKKELKAFKFAVESSYNSICLTNEKKEIIYVNESFEKTTGYTKDEVIGKNPRILKSGKMSKDYYKDINDTLNKGERWLGEFINISKNGTVYHDTASITPIKYDGEIVGYLSINLNVSDYIEKQNEAEFLAYHDALTHLPNRRFLEKKGNDYISRLQKESKKFALFFIDIDGFKDVNDTLGHDIGDLLLKEIAKRFKELLNNSEYIFRVGGDEFVIFIEYSDDAEIDDIATKILEGINEDYIIKENLFDIGCSIGISKFPQNANDLETLLKYADTAMYKSKEHGKNRFEFYVED